MSRFDLSLMVKDLLHRVHVLETTQPMGSSSVSRGRSRFVGNESILVQGSGKVEGWWIVTGTQRVTGRLEGSGTLDWTGPWFLRGLGTISGNTSFTGDMEITGDTSIAGDVTVTADGKIIVGDMTIEPVAGGGRVRFANGATVNADGAGASLSLGNSRVFVDSQHAQIAHGGTLLSVANGNIAAAGIGTFSDPTLPVGVLRSTITGALQRNVG